MSEFRQIVVKAFNENNIISSLAIQPRTYEELCKIFNISRDELEEDKDDNKAYLYLAYDYYKRLIKKIKDRDYEKCKSGAIRIELGDLIVYIDNGNIGQYNRSHYDQDNLVVYVYAKNIDNIQDDILFRSNFMHEITHHLSKNEDDNTLPWNYKDYNNDEINYYTQPTELLSNKIAVCDFMINFIEKNLIRELNTKDLTNTGLIQKHLDNIINKITSTKGFIYHDFFEALAKDKKAFQDFYKEIIETCIEYLQDNMQECTLYSALNDLVESVKDIR